jgi:hypothetical protein
MSTKPAWIVAWLDKLVWPKELAGGRVTVLAIRKELTLQRVVGK